MRKHLQRLVGMALIALFTFSLHAQNTIGIPNMVNYSKEMYAAGSQNWNLVQDKNGIIYIANNDGLLTFDGTFWRCYKLPNKTVLRSLLVADDNKIYVGGQGEIGYFSPAANGELTYTSLNPLIPVHDNDFADVWNICSFQNHLFFRANKKILEYDGHQITIHTSVNWGFLATVQGELLAYEDSKGLVYYSNRQWIPRIKKGSLPTVNLWLRSALPIGKDSILLVSLMQGLFIVHHDTLSAFETPDIREIASKNISSAALLSANRIALATNFGGCFIISKKGKFIQRFTKKEGIQNNNVQAVMMDRDKNLWLGLENGIDLLLYNNAIRSIFPDLDNRNSGYTSLLYKHQLYLGVSTGLYKAPVDTTLSDFSYSIGSFDLVQHSEGQVWNLSAVNGQLLMGHNKGAFIIQGNTAIPLDTKTGYWGFQPLYNQQPSSLIAAGTYGGINFYHYNNGRMLDPVVYSQVESARFAAIGKDVIWIAHPYKGVYRIDFDASGPGVASKYQDRKKILSTNHNEIFKLNNTIVLTTDKGLFEYDERQRDFVRSVQLEKRIGAAPVSYIMEDAYGNIWFARDRKVAVADRASGAIIPIPEIDNRIMASGFSNIKVIDSNNVIIAAEKGFYHINYAQYKKNQPALHVLIRKVQSTLLHDSIIYGGYGKDAPEPEVKHKYNTLHFECAATLFGQEPQMEYSYFLEGFDAGWSAWSKKTERDYTNLPPGDYVFKVKCRNNPANESAVAAFAFHILPSWYQTWWAYTIYMLLFVGVLYLFYKRQQKKYKKLQRKKLLEQQKKYAEEQRQLQLQHQLEIQESEKKIFQLQNEKLQSEVEHKNTELASSAMNLVRKREMLSQLKDNLAVYKEMPDPAKAGREFQKIMKLIDKELNQNEEWEQFVVHFDSVHTNYLKILKEKHPSLTTSDLKLAAYLRLSLSTKEIAQLLGISIRGVETSRYRLRKKLDLDNETHLFDFLMKVTE